MKSGLKVPGVLLSLLLAYSVTADGQPEALPVAPAELVITIEAESLQDMHGPNQSPLYGVPGVTLREQGHHASQSDLSIRGAPFSSAGLLLNGATLRNPQTEHWHADLPLPASWFAPPTLLTGAGRFRAGSGHPAGSVALELAAAHTAQRAATLGGGSGGLLYSRMEATELLPAAYGDAAVSAFLQAERADKSDGYSDNYLKRTTAATRIQRAASQLRGDLFAAWAWRDFGARGFYGSNPRYAAAEERDDLLVGGSLLRHDDPQSPARISFVWQQCRDRYWLDRHHHALYYNEHRSDLLSLHGDSAQRLNEYLGVDLRADADLENLNSASLGDHTRSHTSLALIPHLRSGALLWRMGGSLDLFSSSTPAWLPLAAVELEISDGQKLFASCSKAVREPSYTELNYKSPDSLGNRGLSRQRNTIIEGGWLGQSELCQWSATLFHDRGINIVDWIRQTPADPWQATNLGRLNNWGFNGNLDLALAAGRDLSLELLTLLKEHSGARHASRYALDYPLCEMGLTWREQLNSRTRLLLRQQMAQYRENSARKGHNYLFDSSGELSYTLPRLERATLSLGITNLFGSDFQYFPGQKRAGRRYYAALACRW